MRRLILMLGTNLGDRKENLSLAKRKLVEAFGAVYAESHIYETQAWGYNDEKDYYNQAVVFYTELLPLEVLHIAKAIELVMGRRKKNIHRYESRVIDIDIIMLGDIVLEQEILSIPHSKIANRRFVLEPLCELLPETLHPVLNKTFAELLQECNDKLRVRKITNFNSYNNLKNEALRTLFYNYIVIDGCIGAGKTSLAKMISEEINAKLILEEFEDNDFLPKFYKDPEKYAFPLELSFLSARYNQLSRQLVGFDLFHNGIVADYFMAKSYIFARETLNDDIIRLYTDFFNFLQSKVSQPDIIIYLYMNVDRLLEQIKKRGRAYEQNISGDYLNRIQKGYIDYFLHQKNKRILVVDTNNIDFVNNSDDYNKLLELLKQPWDNKVHRVRL